MASLNTKGLNIKCMCVRIYVYFLNKSKNFRRGRVERRDCNVQAFTKRIRCLSGPICFSCQVHIFYEGC
uniref:Uncharacterized protein n=1 Tax=Octopus bimaculoides TaxID=37653 RepID=A0A0L8HM62_OCTBM